jgi:hypothetical protein
MVVALIVGTAIVICVYSAVVWRKAPSKIWEWWHTLVATVTAAALAVAAGMAMYHGQLAIKDDMDKKVLTMLFRAELCDARRILASEPGMTVEIGNDKLPVVVGSLQALVSEKIGTSGLFDPINSQNALLFARDIKTWNLKVDFFLRSVSASGGSPSAAEQNLRNATKNVIDMRDTLLAKIEMAAKNFGIKMDCPID